MPIAGGEMVAGYRHPAPPLALPIWTTNSRPVIDGSLQSATLTRSERSRSMAERADARGDSDVLDTLTLLTMLTLSRLEVVGAPERRCAV